jgi:acetylornithine deacetylase/succinyl-diaminopimelate desuccinylase-like protein
MRDALMDHLRRHVPLGMRLTMKAHDTAPWWRDEPSGPAVDAAVDALREGFGREPVFIGCGGTIPFVEPIVRAFPGLPAVLVGVEDPICRAHAENESLHLGDWKKGMRASAILYDKLSRVSART